MLQKVIVDANIIFASLHSANLQARRKLLNAPFTFKKTNLRAKGFDNFIDENDL
jgi:hypothetical protein